MIDYVDTNRTLHPSRAGRLLLSQGIITVEVLVVLDNKLSKYFRKNPKLAMDYIAIYFRTVNLRFQSLKSPKVLFKVRFLGLIVKNKFFQLLRTIFSMQ